MTTTSTSTRLHIRKLTARIGAEVAGAGPALELDADAVTALRVALNERKAHRAVRGRTARCRPRAPAA